MDITYLIIDDLNNGIEPNEHLSDDIRVISFEGLYTVLENGTPVYGTSYITKVLEYLLLNHIIKMEVDQ